MTGLTHLITGAGSGMGQLAAKQALANGDKVAALDLNAQGLALLESEAGAAENLLTIVIDITDADAVKKAVEDTEAKFGPIFRVMNAAAIMPLSLLTKESPGLAKKIMDINYGGLVNLVHAALPGMLERRRGQFISFSSIVGKSPTMYMGSYSASKFAVCGYTEVLYEENKNSGVQFACVCPPIVATPLLQQARDTVWPKILDVQPSIEPEEVLEKIEECLSKGKFWVFPGNWQIPLHLFMRKLVPGVIWKQIHKIEGF